MSQGALSGVGIVKSEKERAVVTRPIRLLPSWVNHSAPSAPVVIAVGPAPLEGMRVSVAFPSAKRPIRPALLVYQRTLSGPMVTPAGTLPVGRGMADMTPAVVIRPRLTPASIVYQSAPSGPVAICCGATALGVIG